MDQKYWSKRTFELLVGGRKVKIIVEHPQGTVNDHILWQPGQELVRYLALDQSYREMNRLTNRLNSEQLTFSPYVICRTSTAAVFLRFVFVNPKQCVCTNCADISCS